MAMFQYVTIETTAGPLGGMTRDDRFFYQDDRDTTFEKDGTAITREGKRVTLPDNIEIEDFERECDLHFQKTKDGWRLMTTVSWAEMKH